jgi:shikimate dehydrogenase
LDWRYIRPHLPINGAVVARIARQLQGANVTIPYKQAVMPFLDETDAAARAVGAVNTIVRREDHLIGFNTDTIGFKPRCSKQASTKEQPCAVLGAESGAGRAPCVHEQHTSQCMRALSRKHARFTRTVIH